MSIAVATDYGQKTFDADSYDTYEGELTLYRNGNEVGSVAAGKWGLVEVLLEDVEELKVGGARVWANWLDIPRGVKVADRDGDEYRRSPETGYWECEDVGSWRESFIEDPQHYAPFTEVIK